MKLLAIDPGTYESAYCIIDSETYKPLDFAICENNDFIHGIKINWRYEGFEFDNAVIEMIASYGMPVGKEVFETCIFIGRVYQTLIDFFDDIDKIEFTYRKDVKMNLCNSTRAKDSNIRQALIDRFGDVGKKASPGFFYGFKKDIWAAYAVGVTYLDKQREE